MGTRGQWESTTPTDWQLLTINQLFTTRSIHKLLVQKRPYQLQAACQSFECMRSNTQQIISLGALYDEAYALLKIRRKSEYVYKNELVREILDYHRTTMEPTQQYSVIPEFLSGLSKVDIAVFNGSSTAYEIKTGLDNLDRLASQITDYRKVFQRVHIITDQHHLEHIKALVDPSIGLSVMRADGVLELQRPASDDFSHLEHSELFTVLWAKELVSMYSDITGEELVCPNTHIALICRPLFNALTIEEASAVALGILRQRKSRQRFEAFVHNLPSSLTACASALSLSNVKEHQLALVLAQPLDCAG